MAATTNPSLEDEAAVQHECVVVEVAAELAGAALAGVPGGAEVEAPCRLPAGGEADAAQRFLARRGKADERRAHRELALLAQEAGGEDELRGGRPARAEDEAPRDRLGGVERDHRARQAVHLEGKQRLVARAPGGVEAVGGAGEIERRQQRVFALRLADARPQ